MDGGLGGVRKQRWRGRFWPQTDREQKREREKEGGNEGGVAVWPLKLLYRKDKVDWKPVRWNYSIHISTSDTSLGKLPKSWRASQIHRVLCFRCAWRESSSPVIWKYIKCGILWVRWFHENANRGSDRRHHLGCHASLLTQLLPPEQTSQFVTHWQTQRNGRKNVSAQINVFAVLPQMQNSPRSWIELDPFLKFWWKEILWEQDFLHTAFV